MAGEHPAFPGQSGGWSLRTKSTAASLGRIGCARCPAWRGMDSPVSYGFAQTLRDGRERFSRYPSSAATFGKEYEVGDTFVQPDLARTLDRIARDPNDFYEGETARLLSAAMAANGGLITLEDLKAYKAVERQPLTGSYKDYEVDHRAATEFGRRRHPADAGCARRLGIRKGRRGIGGNDALPRGSHAPLLRRSQRVPGRPGFYEGSGPCAARTRIHQETPRLYRSGPRQPQRHDPARNAAKLTRARKRRTSPSWTRRETRCS